MSEGAWVEGCVERVLWSSAESGYAVVRLIDAESQPFVAVGQLASLAEQAEGAFVALEGQWGEHPVHGRQFRATGALHGSPMTLQGIKLYLASSGVKGVGPALAGRIVDQFGLQTPRLLAEEPQRMAEVPGIGRAKAKAIAEAWTRDEQGRALAMTLRGLGLTARQIHRIRRRFGEATGQVVRRQPYRLAEEISGIGFRTADALALRQGLARDAPERVRAAVLYATEVQAQEGHCWTPLEGLSEELRRLGVPTEALGAAVDAAEGAGRLVVEGEQVWPSALYEAELAVAHELGLRVRQTRAIEVPVAVLEAAERWERVTLDEDQRAAVRLALRGGPVVITGGPGTGKTTLIRVLLRAATQLGAELLLASPTGRAARRLSEATGRAASTIHRLLEYNPGEGGFQRGAGAPLEADGLVIDEVSMVDIRLMEAVVAALPWEAERWPLVFVGDADQLPSVGPGQVLRDLIESGAVPVVRLSTIHRQGAESGIIQAAATIHAGRVPESGERSGAHDVFLLHRPEADRALVTLLDVVADRLVHLGFDPVSEVQVLTPTRRGPLGAERLNEALQARLNPEGKPELVRGTKRYRLGDRVLCVRNRYDVEIFNGDVGRIVEVSSSGLVVDFDGRAVDWSRDELPMLDLAYAITVHKSQGSEYPAVVLVLHGSHSIMLRRNLFYTGATRAKRFLCVVGGAKAWARAAAHCGGEDRRTGLARRLGASEGEVR